MNGSTNGVHMKEDIALMNRIRSVGKSSRTAMRWASSEMHLTLQIGTQYWTKKMSFDLKQ